MKNYIFCFFIIILLFGCTSTQKLIVLQSQNDDVRIYHRRDGSLLLNLPTHTFEWEKKGKIVSGMSYAIDGKGKKYNLATEPFQIAHNHPKPTTYTSDILWLTSPTKSNVKLAWYNNIWEIHVVLKSQNEVDTFEIKFEVSDK